MSTLEEVLAKFDALRKDLEDLGVNVQLHVQDTPDSAGRAYAFWTAHWIIPTIEEDLEAPAPGR